MTTFIVDDSHYGEPLVSRDGINGYTHKITDGNHFYEDSEYQISLNKARTLGTPVLGSYHVLWPGNISAQVDWWVERVTALTPWWVDHPCFIWQLDCEPFSYLPRAPNLAEITTAGDWLVNRYGINRRKIGGYCPKWVYGDTLRGLTIWLWASNYGPNPIGPYRANYPGDASPRWAAYSGQTPKFLQYGSNLVVGGLSTTDVSAGRYASVDDMIADLGGTDMPITDADAMKIADAVWKRSVSGDPAHPYSASGALWTALGRLPGDLGAIRGDIQAVLAAEHDDPSTGTVIDDAARAKIADAVLNALEARLQA